VCCSVILWCFLVIPACASRKILFVMNCCTATSGIRHPTSHRLNPGNMPPIVAPDFFQLCSSIPHIPLQPSHPQNTNINTERLNYGEGCQIISHSHTEQVLPAHICSQDRRPLLVTHGSVTLYPITQLLRRSRVSRTSASNESSNPTTGYYRPLS